MARISKGLTPDQRLSLDYATIHLSKALAALEFAGARKAARLASEAIARTREAVDRADRRRD